MSNTYRNFLMQVSPNAEDDWNDGKSVRKHVVKQRRLQVRQKLRNFNVEDFIDEEDY